MVEWDTGMEYSNDICPKLIAIKVHQNDEVIEANLTIEFLARHCHI